MIISGVVFAGPTVGDTHKSSDETETGKPCPVKLADLDYVGMKFTGPYICIDATTDKQAYDKCNSRVYKRIVNPGNPQYREKAPGTIDTNPEGYYFCLTTSGDEGNDKGRMCASAATKSNYDLRDKLNFDFVKKHATSKDGDCFCSWKDKSQGTRKFKCAQEDDIPQPVDKCKEIGLEYVEESAYDSSTYCKCADGRYFILENAKEKCAQPADAPKPPTTTAAKPEVSKEMRECVDGWLEKSKKCKSKSDEALKVCNPETAKKDETKGSADDVKKAIDTASKMFTASKMGSGAQQECFAGSLIANSAKDFMGGKKDECAAGITACQNECGDDKFQEFEKACLDPKILNTGGNVADDDANGGEANANQSYFSQHQEEIRNNFTEGTKLCKNDSPDFMKKLGMGLDAIGKALASSAECMCKMSSTSQGDCKPPPVETCQQNPNLSGCAVYGGINVCTPGASYNAQLCYCQTNPKGAGCPGGGFSGNLSNFGGPIGKAINNGPDGFNFQAAKPGPAGDINIASTPDDPSGALQQQGTMAEATKSLNASGGGGPGGGSSSGGGREKASGGGDNDNGLGLFGTVKSFFKNMGGGGNNKGNGDANGKANAKKDDKNDPNKFRPRGLAGNGKGIGGKNKDIFKMMNECFNAETCKWENGFMEPSLKQK